MGDYYAVARKFYTEEKYPEASDYFYFLTTLNPFVYYKASDFSQELFTGNFLLRR